MFFLSGRCYGEPREDVLNQRNPTCDLRAYAGGLDACHHKWKLLDADQEIPWTDRPLIFHHKYRFYVQPYNEKYHTQVILGQTAGSALLIGSPWEYDVPKCATDVPGCAMVDGTWIHTINGTFRGGGKLSHASFHC